MRIRLLDMKFLALIEMTCRRLSGHPRNTMSEKSNEIGRGFIPLHTLTKSPQSYQGIAKKTFALITRRSGVQISPPPPNTKLNRGLSRPLFYGLQLEGVSSFSLGGSRSQPLLGRPEKTPSTRFGGDQPGIPVKTVNLGKFESYKLENCSICQWFWHRPP